MHAAFLMDDFPLQAIVRFYPDLRGTTLGVVESSEFKGGTRLLCVSLEAEECRLEVGMTLTQGRELCPELVILPRQERLERSAEESLRGILGQFSPRFEVSFEGSVGWGEVDLSGTERLLGEYGESGRRLERAAAGEGLVGRVGLAETRALAKVLARCGYLEAHPPERAFWEGVPLGALTPSKGFLDAMSRFGIHCVGGLLSLPVDSLVTRVGKEAVALRGVVLGTGRGLPLGAGSGAEELSSRRTFEGAVTDWGRLGAALGAMLEEVMPRVVARGLFCARVELGLTYERGGGEEGACRVVTPARPTREVSLLLELCRLHLERGKLEGGVLEVALRIFGEGPRRHQLGLFEAAPPELEEVEGTLLKLQALLGVDGVGLPVMLDSHRDEAFELQAFCRLRERRSQEEPGSASFGGWGLRRFRPARECEVAFVGGGPRFLRAEEVGGEIVEWRGPYRRCGEWWRSAGEGFWFDWYDVRVARGGRYRLRYDWLGKAWWLMGSLD